MEDFFFPVIYVTLKSCLEAVWQHMLDEASLNKLEE
jgi:hypothetical protein